MRPPQITCRLFVLIPQHFNLLSAAFATPLGLAVGAAPRPSLWSMRPSERIEAVIVNAARVGASLVDLLRLPGGEGEIDNAADRRNNVGHISIRIEVRGASDPHERRK